VKKNGRDEKEIRSRTCLDANTRQFPLTANQVVNIAVGLFAEFVKIRGGRKTEDLFRCLVGFLGSEIKWSLRLRRNSPAVVERKTAAESIVKGGKPTLTTFFPSRKDVEIREPDPQTKK